MEFLQNKLELVYDLLTKGLDSEPLLQTSIKILGMYYLASKSVCIINRFYNCFLKHRHTNYLSTYGKCYAVVTGASDGIGKQLAMDLANKGMHLVLVARNADKLNKVANEIREAVAHIYSDIQIQIIVMDFSEPNMKEYDDLYNTLKQLDIGILVNNVGTAENGDFHHLPKCRDIVNVNIMSQVLMTRTLMPLLVERSRAGRRCLVISLSSIAATRPMPYLQLYSATKAFNSFFSECLRLEYRDSLIEFVAIQPGVVETNMTKSSRPAKQQYDRISTQMFSDGFFRMGDKCGVTAGHWRHQIIQGQLGLLTDNMLCQKLKQRMLNKKNKSQ